MSWNLEGMLVRGRYLNDNVVEGVVMESRVKYGGRVQHRVSLDVPLQLYGTERDTVLLDAEEILEILEIA